MPIYYQFYDPWKVPHVQRVPISFHALPEGDRELRVRIIPAQGVHEVLANQVKGYRPRLADFSVVSMGLPKYGWSLEHFIADEFLACREGESFDSISDARIQNLFYRRTGPIAAAIAIAIEEIGAAR